MNINETRIEKDPSGKKLIVTRKFYAPVNKVWRAWTEADLLEKWWAPKPWKAVTKELDFKDGGRWLYTMAGPNGERQPCYVEFSNINDKKTFTGTSWFCDENDNKTDVMPEMKMINHFEEVDGQTKFSAEIVFKSEADLEKIIQMGFKEGYTMAHGNLDELLKNSSLLKTC